MSMKKIREVLWVTHELGLSVRQVREATRAGSRPVGALVGSAGTKSRGSGRCSSPCCAGRL
jgi:hypothetical protein